MDRSDLSHNHLLYWWTFEQYRSLKVLQCPVGNQMNEETCNINHANSDLKITEYKQQVGTTTKMKQNNLLYLENFVSRLHTIWRNITDNITDQSKRRWRKYNSQQPNVTTLFKHRFVKRCLLAFNELNLLYMTLRVEHMLWMLLECNEMLNDKDTQSNHNHETILLDLYISTVLLCNILIHDLL